MANLSTPSPTLTPVGVGRSMSRGSWELRPSPNVFEGLDVNIEEERQAILDNLLPSASRATPSPTLTRQLAARRDLMIRGLVNGSINPALRPHLAQATADGCGRSIDTRHGPPGGGGEGPSPPPLPSPSPSPPPSGTPRSRRSSGSGGSGRQPRRLSQDGLRRQMDLLAPIANPT